MTATEKDEQKAFMREVLAKTGLTIEAVAERLGREVMSVKKMLWADIRLTESNRAQLQKLMDSYSKGEVVLGVREQPLESGQTSRFGGARGKLRAAMGRRQLSAPQLAKLIRYDAGVIEQVANGAARASEKMIEAIVRELPELSKEDLMGGSDQPQIFADMQGTFGAKPQINLPPGVTARFVPLLSYAQAGAWDADHSDDLYDYTSIIALNVDDRRAFAIAVLGNSMEPVLREGDMVICSPSKQPHNGEAAVIKTRSGQIYIKFWHKKGERVLLESANPDHKTIDVPASEIAGAWQIVQTVQKGAITKQL